MSKPEPEPSPTLAAPPSVPPSDRTAFQTPPTSGLSPTAAQTDGAATDRHAAEAPTGDGGTMAQATPSAAAMVGAPVVVRIPGYEILGELGRGGMGVVYKARQLGLNRLVAIKMILSGDYADSGDLARFRLEAEAVAKLQHPNIVQVYAIDEAEGSPISAWNSSTAARSKGNWAATRNRRARPPAWWSNWRTPWLTPIRTTLFTAISSRPTCC